MAIQSTITDNHANGVSSDGGGLYTRFGPTTFLGSIVAGNTAAGANPDIRHQGNDPLAVDYSLIGDTSGTSIDGATDIGDSLNVDPMLGPLQDNGGLTGRRRHQRQHAALCV